MKTRRVMAILGAGVLTLGVVTVALAATLKVAHQGITVSWDEEGNAVIGGGFPNSTDCPWDPAQGEAIFHFVQSGGGQDPTTPNPGGNAANTLDVDFDDEADANDVPADSVHENQIDWFVGVDASDGSVTVVNAESNAAGGELKISHICVGEAPGDEETPPPTAPPTPFQSVNAETDAPTPFQSVGGDTDAPTEPNTATVGSTSTGTPGDGAWLLVVALGVLLASIVVLTPARAKAPRR